MPGSRLRFGRKTPNLKNYVFESSSIKPSIKTTFTIDLQPAPSSLAPHPPKMVSLKALAVSALAASVSAQSTNATIRYMPFGDSITEIICWRAKLWEKLQSTEWASVNWVGSGKTENNCKDTKYDRDNEGHSGFLAIDIANKGQLDGWLKTNPADVITMHLGTNGELINTWMLGVGWRGGYRKEKRAQEVVSEQQKGKQKMGGNEKRCVYADPCFLDQISYSRIKR